MLILGCNGANTEARGGMGEARGGILMSGKWAEKSVNNEMVSGEEEAMGQKALSIYYILPEAQGHYTEPASLGKVGLEPG